MTANALENIEKLEKSLWNAADTLRANSKLTSSEYCMPVRALLYLVFLSLLVTLAGVRLTESPRWMLGRVRILNLAYDCWHNPADHGVDVCARARNYARDHGLSLDKFHGAVQIEDEKYQEA